MTTQSINCDANESAVLARLLDGLGHLLALNLDIHHHDDTPSSIGAPQSEQEASILTMAFLSVQRGCDRNRNRGQSSVTSHRLDEDGSQLATQVPGEAMQC